MVFYCGEAFGGPYKVRFLDDEDSFFGLASKGYWPNVILRGEELVLPPTTDELGTYPDREKIIRAIHWAGGNQAGKMNYRLHFQPNVCKRLDELVK